MEIGFFTNTLVALLTLASLSFVANLFKAFFQIRKLKGDGQDPLIGRSIAMVVGSYIAEVLVAFFVVLVASALHLPETVPTIVAVVATGVVLQEVGAYLTVWGILKIIVTVGVGKKKKEIEKDIKENLKKGRA